MNKQALTNKQSGFSLVELMVVVAIIGILATLSVGSIQKQVAKSRQAEAKTNLSALWSAESAFHGEFGWYYTNLQAIKYSAEGNVRYDVGFFGTTSAAAATTFGYTGAGAATNTVSFNTCTGANQICHTTVGGNNGMAGANTTCSCTTQATTNAGTLNAATVPAIGQNNFRAAASTDLLMAQDDEWTIDNSKTMNNTLDGIQ